MLYNSTLRIHGKHELVVNEFGCQLNQEIMEVKAKSFLKNFGIYHGTIFLNYLNDRSCEEVQCMREIGESVAKYCANTLSGLFFSDCYGNVLENITFDKVTTVIIISSSIEGTQIDLNKSFPNTKHMYITREVLRNAEYLKRNFKFLGAIHFLQMRGELDSVVERNFREVIQLNPQIKNIKTTGGVNCGAEYLEFLNETLTQLESLALFDVDFEQPELMKHIHFQSLNTFRLECNNSSYPDNISISFGQLEELHLRGVSDDPKWIDFILENKCLKKLTYGSNANVNNLTQIVTQLPKLSHLIFETTDAIFTAEEFNHFLEICASIMNLERVGKLCSEENWMNEFNDLENINDNLNSIFMKNNMNGISRIGIL